MDFKVAGTDTGITAIQLDIKLDGITLDIVKDTLERARKARVDILEVMNKALPAPRSELSPYAPRIQTLHIDPEKIGDVIGPGGKIINKIIDETDVSIDIEDDGQVYITSTSEEMMKKAVEWIQGIVKEIEVGEIYEGKVMQIMKDRFKGTEVGAIVSLGEHHDGMIHISQVAVERIARVSDVLKVGDTVKVKVVEIDKERGRISLSRKVLLPGGESDSLHQRPRSSDRGGYDRGRRE